MSCGGEASQQARREDIRALVTLRAMCGLGDRANAQQQRHATVIGPDCRLRALPCHIYSIVCIRQNMQNDGVAGAPVFYYAVETLARVGKTPKWVRTVTV